jgi:hypothetical protein
LHQTDVVDQLADKLKTLSDPAERNEVYGALARLNYREADWTGDSCIYVSLLNSA